MAQFERITYQRVFNLGNYESIRIGADVLINPGEDAKQALNEAKEFVEQWRKENNAYHFADTTPDIPIIPKQEKVNNDFVKEYYNAVTQTIDEQIKSCANLKVLESYKFIVKGKPDLETIYQSKLKELSHD